MKKVSQLLANDCMQALPNKAKAPVMAIWARLMWSEIRHLARL